MQITHRFMYFSNSDYYPWSLVPWIWETWLHQKHLRFCSAPNQTHILFLILILFLCSLFHWIHYNSPCHPWSLLLPILSEKACHHFLIFSLKYFLNHLFLSISTATIPVQVTIVFPGLQNGFSATLFSPNLLPLHFISRKYV